MTEKRFKNIEEKLDWGTVQYFTYDDEKISDDEIEDLVNQLLEENEQLKKEKEQLKKDVEYWKQVASQYSNELNVFEHCKKYKTKCKDIYWSSGVDG